MDKSNYKQTGFTIVELLVVIVVIGILAAVTIVSYTGIAQKAAVATLKSDLRSASTSLGLDNVTTGSYPATKEDANGGLGLPKSVGTTYQYTLASGSYCLSATSIGAGATYRISSSVGVIENGICALTWGQIMTAGAYDVCGIASNSQAYCWGANNAGGLGDNSTTERHVPVAVNTAGVLSGKTIKSITNGSYHTCAIASDDAAYCWGLNDYGELGYNSYSPSSVPVAITNTGVLNGKTIKSIAAGYIHTCTVASDNLAYCWGDNTNGQLGNNSTTQSTVPVAVNTAGVLSGKTILAITSGTSHTCAIASDNLAYCWGYNWNGQLGDNSTTQRIVPIAVNTAGVLSGKTIKSIAAGYSTTCVIASDDKAYCWGYNWNGQLGDNSTTERHVPVAVDTTSVLAGKTVKAISVGENHTCAIASDNLAYCWGNNANGRLGDNSTTERHVPVAVDTTGVLSGKTVKTIAAGEHHACVVASDNQAYCWGYNPYGGLGNNSTTESHVPVAVLPLP